MSRSEANIGVSHKDNEVIKYAHASATTAGEVLHVDGIGALVAAEVGDAAESISYYYRGTVQIPITAGVTITQGQKVYWDVSANTAVLADSASLVSGDFFVGTAVAAGTAAGGYVTVSLNDDPTIVERGYKTITAETETVEETDYGLILDATSNTVTVTLPSAATSARLGKKYAFICENANNTVTISRAGADTVMGAASITLDVREAVVLVPVGTDWIAESNAYNMVTAQIGADSVNGSKIADESINSEHYVDGSIDLEHLADGILAANSTGRAKMAADFVTGAQIADESIDSEHYVDGSIDLEHLADGILAASSTGRAKMANDFINADKIGDDVINSEHYAAGSIDLEHLADGILAASSTGRAKMAADFVTGAQMADNAVSLEHLDAGITPAYICVGYGTVASNAGTQGTIAVTGALTSDYVIASALAGWTAHTSGGPGISASVTGANAVTYNVGGTGFCGTAGGVGVSVMRAAS